MTRPFVSYFLLLINDVSRVFLVEYQSKILKYSQIPIDQGMCLAHCMNDSPSFQ